LEEQPAGVKATCHATAEVNAGSQRVAIRAVAAMTGLDLSDEEVERALPWLLDIRRRLERLHEVAQRIPQETEPAPFYRAWTRGEMAEAERERHDRSD
jgi:hypothetical protein